MRHGQSGLYAAADLPQRPSIEQYAMSTGWSELDEILKFYPGQFVVVTGKPGSGKSTFLMNLVCNRARLDGVRTLLYTPEHEWWVVRKLQKIWCANGARNEASFKFFAQYQCFVQSSDFIDDYDQEPRTINWILDRCVAAVRHDDVSMIVLDPWNEIERAIPKNMMLTDYIAECIRLMKQFCRVFDVQIIIVAHPTKAINENGDKPPRLCDIEGSMAWWNKADNGLIVTRKNLDARACVISEKVREIGAGRLGECYFTVDPQSGIFTPEYGGVTL